MKVTQSKKTGKFSLTQLEKSDLVNLHNTLSDYALKSQIRLALLDLMPGDERVKLQTEEAVNEYFESEGLVLKSFKASSDGNGTPVNLPSGSTTNGVVTSPTFQSAPVTASDDEGDEEEDTELEDSEELEEEELPM